MAKYGFLERGGMEGIEVTKLELWHFSDMIGSNHLDDYIPIPDVEVEEQQSRIHHHLTNESCGLDTSNVYWENIDSGGHGWCCNYCGKVHQWG